MPEILYDTQEAVPEPFRESAKAKDGKFAINVVEQSQLDQFRDNNLTISRERDGLSATIAKLKTDIGFEPEKLDEFVTGFNTLKQTAKRVEDGELIANSSLEEALTARTAEMRTAHEAQVNALTTSVKNLQTENGDLKRMVDDNVIVTEITAAAADKRSGLRADALRGVLAEARSFFKVQDGKLIAKDAQGNTVYGADGTSPISPLEWIKSKLSETAPYLFAASEGGGAGGGKGLGGLTQEQLAALEPAERMRLARANKI